MVADLIAALPIWPGSLTVEPLPGGLTNRNFKVFSAGHSYVVRLAGDVAAHGIDRAAELAATRAAAALGLGPNVIHAEPGVLVLAHVEGRTLTAEDLADPRLLALTLDLLRRVAAEIPSAVAGLLRDRSPRAVLAAYQSYLDSIGGPWVDRIRPYQKAIASLPDLATGEGAFVHGDIHAGNLIDDGNRLWLVDWEYAGQGLIGQDLASLISNGPTDHTGFTDAALTRWFGHAPTNRERAYVATLQRAAALRDLFWGYAQSALDPMFDGADYLRINESRVAALLE